MNYNLIEPQNNVFIENPITGQVPNYNIEQFREIFVRFLDIIEQYNNFSSIRRVREDEEMEDFPPLNILDFQTKPVVSNFEYISSFNRNRMISTMNFISAQFSLSKHIANDPLIKDITNKLHKGFRCDPMTSVPIHR